MKDETKTILAGRDPETHFGAVNPPVYRASTIIYPSLAAIRGTQQIPYTYGRRATPTTDALTKAMIELEQADGCVLTPSGLSAVTLAILSAVKTGDHLLMVDSAYTPTRSFCDKYLVKMGVETEYYDPLIGGDIAKLIRPNTALIFTESPGSQTFEVQDIPAIVAAAKAANALTAIDNTWASHHYFKPLVHGIDISVQAATKYIIGHADALLGTVCARGEVYANVKRLWNMLGMSVGPDDVYLALRGLRSLPARLAQHSKTTLDIASWLETLPFIRNVLYPALPSHAGHTLWQRDFTGATGLFAIETTPCSEDSLAAMLDNMRLFSMGYSWGGYESLIVPGEYTRQCRPYETDGHLLRLHIGLEHGDDLQADLADGFARAGFATA